MGQASNDEGAGSEAGSDRSVGDLVRLVPAVVLVIVLVAFSFANTQRTKVDLVVTEVRAPLVLVLLATAIVGALISALVRFRRRHSH